MSIFGRNNSADAGGNSSLGKEPLRFRLYYRLMDVSLVTILLAILLGVSIRAAGIDPESLPIIIAVGVPLIIYLVNYVIIPVLILVSKLRDEYADLLWKRTVAQLTVLTVLIPPIVSALIWFLYLVILDGNPEANWGGNRPDWLLDPIYAEEVRLYTVLEIWGYYTLGFVILFQFNRWRDSRATSE